jgi:hypothetical protein
VAQYPEQQHVSMLSTQEAAVDGTRSRELSLEDRREENHYCPANTLQRVRNVTKKPKLHPIHYFPGIIKIP